MIKDIISKYEKMSEAAGRMDVSVDDILEINEQISNYALNGVEIVTRSVKEEDFALLRTAFLKTLCAFYGVTKKDFSLLLSAKSGVLVEYTDTMVFAIIGVLYEEGAL